MLQVVPVVPEGIRDRLQAAEGVPGAGCRQAQGADDLDQEATREHGARGPSCREGSS